MKSKNNFLLRVSESQMIDLRAMAKREKKTVSAIIRSLIDEKRREIRKVRNGDGLFSGISRS